MIFAMHDPLADLLGEWSRGLNTGSVLLRIALAVLACGGDPTHFGRGANGQANATRQGCARLCSYPSPPRYPCCSTYT